MKIFFSMLILISLSFAGDNTIEVIKKVQSLPTIAVEDSSISYDDAFKMRFFKSIIADLNVISMFNVDRHYRTVQYNSESVIVENINMDYVLRYKLFESDDGSLNVELNIFNKANIVFSKNYKINRKDIYVFISHTIAYDINEFMGGDSVEWMKRRVIFSRVVAPRKTEIVISDYTLAYQHTVISGGFNVFPKWGNKKQTTFYYTSLDGLKPVLKHINTQTGKSKSIITADGMVVCSDVSKDGSKLLLTLAPNGQPDIYTYDVETKEAKKQTYYGGIDVNAQFVDNENIVFVSGRLGYPNLFTKKIDANNVDQLVFYGKSNAACAVHGGYVVYKARETSNAFSANTFNLHLMSSKTDFVRRLTVTGVNEFPRFSKDGDAILFIKSYMSQSAIGIIRLNHNKNYLFPLKHGKLQSMDW